MADTKKATRSFSGLPDIDAFQICRGLSPAIEKFCIGAGLDFLFSKSDHWRLKAVTWYLFCVEEGRH